MSGGPGKDKLKDGQGEDVFEISRDTKKDIVVDFDLKKDEILASPDQYDNLTLSRKKKGVLVEALGEGKLLLKGVSYDDFLDTLDQKCLFRWTTKDERDQFVDDFVG